VEDATLKVGESTRLCPAGYGEAGPPSPDAGGLVIVLRGQITNSQCQMTSDKSGPI